MTRVLTTAKDPTGREVWFRLKLPFGRHFTAYAMLINTREVDRVMREGFSAPPDDETRAPIQDCVACGRPCPPRRRWCSTACFYAEDGYPSDEVDEAAEDDDD